MHFESSKQWVEGKHSPWPQRLRPRDLTRTTGHVHVSRSVSLFHFLSPFVSPPVTLSRVPVCVCVLWGPEPLLSALIDIVGQCLWWDSLSTERYDDCVRHSISTIVRSEIYSVNNQWITSNGHRPGLDCSSELRSAWDHDIWNAIIFYVHVCAEELY